MRCKGHTLSGKPCKRNAQISGYCIDHLVSGRKQAVTTKKQPKFKYMEKTQITWEEVRDCKNKIQRLKLLKKYHDWIRLKRYQDKRQKRRDDNKDYRERVKLKSSKKD